MQALQDLTDRIRAAAAERRPLAIRGGGSKDFYGEPRTGERLDTRALAGIVSYEPSELVVSVRAGTPLAELEAALAEQGQCLPFEPPHFAHSASATARGAATRVEPLGERVQDSGATAGSAATVGGMVAAGLSGPARASVGAVRDYLLGAELVNGRGERLRFGGTVMKNVAGYDVSRVLAGSLGTLGLVTEVSLKVMPRAPAEATLRFACGQAEALQRLNAWGGQPLPLNASRWRHDGGGTLWLRLRGAKAAVEAACRALSAQGGTRCDTADSARDWQACRDQHLPWFAARPPGHALWRLSVPQTAPVLALPGEPLVEWHGAQRWLWAPPEAGPTLRAAAAAVSGHATVFIADRPIDTGATGRFDSIFTPLPPTLAAIQAALRREFDPAGIFHRATPPDTAAPA